MTAHGGFLYTVRGGLSRPPGLRYLAISDEQRMEKAANLTDQDSPVVV
jgi:hypothetical protein